MSVRFETKLVDTLLDRLAGMTFGPPVAYIYNPLEYARRGFETYCRRYGRGPKEVVLVGMNPGPWGMAQTGVPFGEVGAVANWMVINPGLGKPPRTHPKKPVMGLDCPRREVSGKRLWSWARNRFGTPEDFFSRFFVINYCPLMFLDAGGRNLPLDKLPAAERGPLLEVCDLSLAKWVEHLEPKFVIGIGNFAYRRIQATLGSRAVTIGRIIHPSPANPRANRGWAEAIEAELVQMGVVL